MPEINAEQKSFIGQVMRTNFLLSLTQPMIEFLCATADDVHWDRRRCVSIHVPNNWLATEAALTKRGLIRRKPRVVNQEAQYEYNRKLNEQDPSAHLKSYCELTPIGLAVVELFKVAGIFVKADDAFVKESKGKA